MKKELTTLFIVTILVTLTLNVIPVFANESESPVYISNNADFVTYATSGDGTKETPYLISEISVSAPFTNIATVYIENTDAYFILSNSDILGSAGYGIYMESVSNGVIEENNLFKHRQGIVLSDCNNVNITGNTIVSDDYGIFIEISRECNIIGNTVNSTISLLYRSNYGCVIDGNVFIGGGMRMVATYFADSGIKVRNNIVNGKLLGFLFNGHDLSIEASSYGQAIIIASTNITVYDGNFEGNHIGVSFLLSQNCEVTLSNIANNYIGVSIQESTNIRLSYNNITNNHHGVIGNVANGIAVTSNIIAYNSGYGLWAQSACSSSVIYNNVFMNNILGNAKDDGGIADSHITWVAGRFVNSVSKQPLSGVKVTAQWSSRSWVGYTNQYGILKIAVPELTTYDLTIEKFRYETKTPSVNIDDTGIHLFRVNMNKANLGPGTGYVLVKFMDDTTPVVGANIEVYSTLDGAYYFHSEYTSASGVDAGWANITGLYYDDYVFVVTHPDYEQRIINQVIISDGHAATYNNIQLVEYPTDAFIYGTVKDFVTQEPIENANITMRSDFDSYTIFTDVNGFYNMTNIHFGTYSVIISCDNYVTDYHNYVVDNGGNQNINPYNIALYPDDYVPIEPLQDGVVNNWDNQVIGNYWDDLGENEIYIIQGENIFPTEDEYPFISIEDMDLKPPEPTQTTTIITTTTTTTTTTIPPIDSVSTQDLILMGIVIGFIVVLSVIFFYKKHK